MSDRLNVCLGYPLLLEDLFRERLQAIDPGIRLLEMPIDNGGDWISVSPAEPHAEPPVWAASCGPQRRAALAEAEVLIALHVPARLMELAPKLRWIQGVGAGVEQFAATGVPRDRVLMTNASGLSAASMAEFVIGRLLEVWKRTREIEALQRDHNYRRSYGRTFKGSVVGIVGMGHIGREVAIRARALGARVVGNKRSKPSSEETALVDAFFTPDQLHEMLSECDAVVIAAPATPATHHLMNARALAAMKPGATLVNVARGSLLDDPALIDAMRSGHIGASVLDVTEQEPLPADSELWDLPNVYLSAHSSVSVDRYNDDVFELFEENLRRFVRGETLRNVVDMEALGFQ